MKPLYDLFAMMPTGEIIHVRKSVPHDEAERVAGILVNVSEKLHGHLPKRQKDRWYIVSSDWRENGMVLCWIKKSITIASCN